MFFSTFFDLNLTLNLTPLGSNVKRSATIEFYIPNGPANICHMALVLYFYTVTLFDRIDLDLCLALVPYLYGIFFIPSVALLHSLGLQLSLVCSWHPISRRESTLSFDLTLARHLTFLRKSSYSIRIISLRAFDRRLALVTALIGSKVGQGGNIRPLTLPSQSTEGVWRPRCRAG